jgi:hypothetical protein
MIRAAMLRSLWVVFWGTSLALAQEPPLLEGPASEPSPPKNSAAEAPRPTPPPTTTPAPPRGAVASPVGPTLAIPGVTVPSPRLGAATGPAIPPPSRPSTSSTPPTDALAPSLAGPSNLDSPFRPTDAPRAQDVPSAASLAPVPLSLEPLDDDPAPALDRPRSRSPRESQGRRSGSSPTDESDSALANPRPTPRRMPGFLGRVLGQPPAGSSRNSARSSDGASRTKTKSEPESDAVVQRRIEQQIRSTLGDKVQSIQVRVSGRNVLIVGRATRFWQKRGVYRSLESLPGLAGYRAQIDLDD